MPAGESPRHCELKRLTLRWAQVHGYRIAAAEVDVPFLASRIDVAAFRPTALHPRKDRVEQSDALLGTAIVFECKQSRADFLKDSRSETRIAARLARLHELRAVYEESMRLVWPNLRNSDTLFPEFDTCRFEAAGYEPYDKLVREMRTLSTRLHAQTKFARLVRWRAANLHYVVAEEGVARPHELPYGWGLLVHRAGELKSEAEPTWQDAAEEKRAALFLRIAVAATRALNRSHGVFPARPA